MLHKLNSHILYPLVGAALLLLVVPVTVGFIVLAMFVVLFIGPCVMVCVVTFVTIRNHRQRVTAG